MPLTDPALVGLADHFGIATEFWDWKGRHTEVAEATVVAVLGAMDCDVSTPEKARQLLRDVHDRPWRQMLPSCVVTRQGQHRTVEVHVVAGESAELMAQLEAGGTRPFAQVDNSHPDREIDGQWIGEASFAVPTDLPLGYHRLVMRSGGQTARSTLIVTPSFLGFPSSLGERRLWGYATQLYSLRSRDSWGIGDLGDLADLAVWSSTRQGAGYVLINPLHAAEPTAPMEPSPYLPTSRRYVNPIYIRPEAVAEYATLAEPLRDRIAALRSELAPEVDDADRILRNRVWQAKKDALWTLFHAGRRPARQMSFEYFIETEGASLRDFAVWSALAEQLGSTWHQWPAALRDPRSTGVQEFAEQHAERVDFHCWLQWIAQEQISDAQQAAVGSGMGLGVISDLAVGVNPDGADTWMLPDVFAGGVTVGAPPDAFNQAGQDWGQPPWRPDRLADLVYAPFRGMVHSILRHCGGIRVDHIIGLFRLWWVPRGMSPQQGAYVRYDHEAMVGILALEAHRAGALVVGEDLGTVEPWVRDYLAGRGVLGTSVLWFEYDDAGNVKPPQNWREYCLGSVTTHDLPPTAGYLAGDHVRLRDEVGLLTQSLEVELETSAKEHSTMLGALRGLGLLDPDTEEVEEIVLAMHRFLVATPSRMLNAALTDAVGDRRTQNQPGTIDEYPNWRIPLSGPDGTPMLLEEVFTSARARRLAAVLNSGC